MRLQLIAAALAAAAECVLAAERIEALPWPPFTPYSEEIFLKLLSSDATLLELAPASSAPRLGEF
jgi:hypothetical protein